MSAVEDDTGTSVDPRVLRTRQDVLPAAVRVLFDEGWDAVSHARIAQEAGYSKATLYSHWPGKHDLLVDAFTQFVDVRHATLTGDLRADLVAELLTFRDAMLQRRLDRALAVLADLQASVPDLIPVRDRAVVDGERVIRELLAPHLSGLSLDAATTMLFGSVLHSALLHGTIPLDAQVAAAVDLLLDGLGPTPP